ncbi:MAG: sugar transferase [Bacilli bacterium]|nr:sugar transferase [Bacilli bacterium]
MNNEVAIVQKDLLHAKAYSKRIYRIIKRIFDIMISLIGCVFMIPIGIVIKIISVITGDLNPIIFSQSRIGQDGKEFKFYKFRSMVPNADEALFKLLEKNEDRRREYELNKKLENDPRITKVGKFLRKTSIDELPQLINVLKGDMSLIGNRPYLPREKDDMGEYFSDIVKTKPGLTGYWYVSLYADSNCMKGVA